MPGPFPLLPILPPAGAGEAFVLASPAIHRLAAAPIDPTSRFTTTGWASTMATFFVIPPRECLEQAIVEFVGRVLPSVPTSPAVLEAFLGALELEANRQEDVFFIHREDLGGFDDPVRELIEAFGAETGDKVIEIGATVSSRAATLRRCTVRERVSEKPAVR